MPNLSTLMQLLKYAPTILGVVKQFRPAQTPDTTEELRQTHHDIESLRKELNKRIESLEQENTALKARVRDMTASFAVQQVLTWTSLGVAIIAVILGLIAVIR